MLTHPDVQKLQLVICDSETDASAILQTGLKSVRVVSRTDDLYRSFDGRDELDPSLSFFKSFVLAVRSATLRDDLAMRLGDVNCTWVDFSGLESLDVLAREQRWDELQNAIATARPMWTDEICRMSDVPEPTPEQVYEIGIRDIDEHGFRLVRPAFMPVIGPYGSGKSVLLRQLSVNLYRKHGWRTLLTSFEEKIKPRYQRDLRRHIIGKPLASWNDTDIARADVAINNAFRFLRRRRGESLTLERLLGRIEYAVKVYGVDVVIIDPVNEIDHQVPHGESKTDYMGRFIMALKALADDYNLLMIVAAHPPKDGVEKRLSKGRLLTLNDGADTAHWGNKADIGWVMWRAEMDGPTLLHIDKLKDHETMGKPTLVELELDARLNCFNVKRIGYDILA